MKRVEGELEVCADCGWNKLLNHECHPAAGALADHTASLCSDVFSTKLGYGPGKLTFNFDEDHSITFAVGNGVLYVESLHWLSDLTAAGAAGIVHALSARVTKEGKE